ncbi:MAG: hypothetical protein HC910_19980 [Spirulinaceae cyanobacterium SM2_1_0]|nr:hypothetical protein [Spirulinaceae cyanobacterium SM2_1_0]
MTRPTCPYSQQITMPPEDRSRRRHRPLPPPRAMQPLASAGNPVQVQPHAPATAPAVATGSVASRSARRRHRREHRNCHAHRANLSR